MKKIITMYLSIIMLVIAVIGVTYAAFSDKGTILGSTFSVGSSDLKLLLDVAGDTSGDNLADNLAGPEFTNISSNWEKTYPVKIYNNGSSEISLTTNANYLTANDPGELRQLIFVEIFDWDDANINGLVDDGELGASYGKDTIVKWKTQGFALGALGTGQLRGLALKFTAPSVPDTKQGASGIFDFEFTSVGQ